MGSTKTTLRTVRLTNEVAEFFEKKPLNRVVEDVYELIRQGEIKFDGENIKVECTHQNEKKPEKIVECAHPKTEKVCTPDENYNSICEMAGLLRIEPAHLFEALNTELEEGTLYLSNGRLRSQRYEEFENTCERKHVNIDNLLMRVIRDVENGK